MYKEKKELLDLYVHMVYIKHRSYYNKRKRCKIVIRQFITIRNKKCQIRESFENFAT